jgi:hypothetical protein
MNALSEYLRELAAAHRATAADHPDDPRYESSAAALEALASYAENRAEDGAFQMRYLLEHHVDDGRFRWPGGQAGRAISYFGFDAPVREEWELEQFLMDICDLCKSDASRHIGASQSDVDRDDAPALAKRYGLDLERVHSALDAGRRYAHLWIVGIPDWHEIDDAARDELEALDGVVVARAPGEQYDEPPPLLVKNVPAADEDEARERIARIVSIEPGALGVAASGRVL